MVDEKMMKENCYKEKLGLVSNVRGILKASHKV